MPSLSQNKYTYNKLDLCVTVIIGASYFELYLPILIWQRLSAEFAPAATSSVVQIPAFGLSPVPHGSSYPLDALPPSSALWLDALPASAAFWLGALDALSSRAPSNHPTFSVVWLDGIDDVSAASLAVPPPQLLDQCWVNRYGAELLPYLRYRKLGI